MKKILFALCVTVWLCLVGSMAWAQTVPPDGLACGTRPADWGVFTIQISRPGRTSELRDEVDRLQMQLENVRATAQAEAEVQRVRGHAKSFFLAAFVAAFVMTMSSYRRRISRLQRVIEGYESFDRFRDRQGPFRG